MTLILSEPAGSSHGYYTGGLVAGGGRVGMAHQDSSPPDALRVAGHDGEPLDSERPWRRIA